MEDRSTEKETPMIEALTSAAAAHVVAATPRAEMEHFCGPLWAAHEMRAAFLAGAAWACAEAAAAAAKGGAK